MALKMKFDFKAFFINHGEKIAFGVGVFIVLLALMGTSWIPFGKSPEEFVYKITQADNGVAASEWPADLQKNFAMRDYGEKMRVMRGPLELARYSFSVPLWWPLYKKQELAREPDLLAVLDLEAKAGVFVLAVAPKVTPGAEGLLADSSTTANGAAAAAPAVDEEFGLSARTPAGVSGAPGAYPLGNGAAPSAGTLSAGFSNGASLDNYAPPSSYPGDGMSGGYPGMMGMMGEYTGGLGSGVTGRGERFVAVRGVWPLQQQLDKFRTALNLTTRQEARIALELIDFVIERQTAVAGSDPWSDPWTSLDIQRAKDVLAESSDYEIDTFDPRLTDVTITMPLPKRVTGVWGDVATHPQIKNFELKGDALAKELKLQERLTEEYEKLSAKLQPAKKARGGFAGLQNNFKGMADSIYASAETTRMFERDMETYNNNEGAATGIKLNKEEMKARLKSAAERLLLFRYFDFDVQPGFAYRYRVKLIVRNPNYQKPLEQLVHKSYADGETRESPMSLASNAAVVPESTNFFLREVDRDPLHESTRSGSRTLASVSFFQWEPTVGTMIHDTVNIKSIAQFVGEKVKSYKLDVAKKLYKKEDVTFLSNDLYLDGLGDTKIMLDDHKDLKVPNDQKGRLLLVAEALLVDSAGDLKAVTASTKSEKPAKEKELENRVERERKPFEQFKDKDPKAAPTAMGSGAYEGDLGSYPGMDGFPGLAKGKGKAKGGKKNPLKPMGSSSSGGGMMRFMPDR